MRKKIKLFCAKEGPQKLEIEVNQWLALNEDAKIITLTSNTISGNRKDPTYMIVLLYEVVSQKSPDRPEKKREHDRKSVLDVLDYMVDGKYYRDFVEDVSASGLFIRTNNEFKVGANITMTFELSTKERPFRINGEIVRVLPEGIGVRFIKESQVQEDAIQSLIENIE